MMEELKSITVQDVLDAYETQWIEEFGNVPNDSLRAMWKSMVEIYEEQIRANKLTKMGSKDAPEFLQTVVHDAPMSSGKTTLLKMFLKMFFDTQFYRALIVVETIKDCDDYEEDIGKDKCIAIHSDNNIDFLTEVEREVNAIPIIVITHQRLKDTLTKGNIDNILKYFELFVIDEQISTYQHVSFTYHEIHKKIKAELEAQLIDVEKEFPNLNTFIEMFSISVRSLEDRGENLTQIVDYSDSKELLAHYSYIVEELDTIISTVKMSKEDMKYFTTFRNKVNIAIKNGRMKIIFWEKQGKRISFNVVVDYYPKNKAKVILDGTAGNNDMYKFITTHLGKEALEVKTYPNVRDFSNLTINWYKMPTGKNSISLKEVKGKGAKINIQTTLDSLIQQAKDRYGKDEKVLFIVHKDNVDYMLPKIENTNYAITWWGQHKGLNTWKDYSKVIIWGLNHLPSETYTAMYYSTFTINTIANTYPIDDLKASMFTIDIAQGLSRGSIRQCIDTEGNCPKGCEVILGLPNNNTEAEGILLRLSNQFPNATIQEISDGVKIDTNPSNTKKMNKLLADISKIQKSLKEKCSREKWILETKNIDFTSKQLRELLIDGANATKNNQLLLDNNWVYTKLSKAEAVELGIKCGNRGTYVFKYIGSFEDEYIEPTKDINGEEY